MGEGREGDWECNGCKNRNYAFRSFCNRCKQPRLLVDTKTPADSKWLPRIGDWICSGCTNNNYASREKCKKCGQPKEIAAMPAIAMPGASVPTYSHYFDRAPGGLEQKMNIGIGSNGAVQQLPLSSSWLLGGNEKFGVNTAASWPFAGNHSSGVPYENPSNQAPPVMKEWRNGDWICNCGFHNYSSRAQCKKCNASIPPGYTTLGTKRLASEEFVHDWDNKRLNSGYTNGQQKMYPGVGQVLGSAVDMKMGAYAPYAGVSSERSNGVMETGCAQIATIIIMHPVQSVIGARLKKKQWFSQSVRRSYKAAEALDCCGFAGSHCSMLAKNMKDCCTPVSLP